MDWDDDKPIGYERTESTEIGSIAAEECTLFTAHYMEQWTHELTASKGDIKFRI
jgi:hypothetical protein